jgi:transcription elongation GreA/GreB family factor
MNDEFPREPQPLLPDDDPVRLKAEHAVLHATVTITRKATGKVETYSIVGTLADDDNDER